MKTLIIFLSLFIATTASAEEKRLPCFGKEATPCVKRSNICWGWETKPNVAECCGDTASCLYIFKERDRDDQMRIGYCFTIVQEGEVNKILVGAYDQGPKEIIRDMFCSEEEQKKGDIKP